MRVVSSCISSLREDAVGFGYSLFHRLNSVSKERFAGKTGPMTVPPRSVPLSAEFFRRHLLDDLLPFWLRNGVDRQDGGFVTHLDRQGNHFESPLKPASMQARMLYGFAAGFAVSGDDRLLEQVRNGLTYLIDRFWDPRHGGWFKQIRCDGGAPCADKDAFTQANLIVGLIEAHRRTHDASALHYAQATWELLDRHLWDQRHHGCFSECEEDWSPKTRRKSLGAHVNILRAGLALFGVTADARCRERCHELAELIGARMTDPRHGGMREYFSEDWRYLPRLTLDRRSVGHGLESASALLELDRITHGRDHAAWTENLIDFCLRRGWDDEYGGLHQHHSSRGRLATGKKYWWTQCEGMIALGRIFALTGIDRYHGFLQRLADFSFNFFSDAAYGEWFTSCLRDGRPADFRKGGDWKAAYHTVSMCLALQQALASSQEGMSS